MSYMDLQFREIYPTFDVEDKLQKGIRRSKEKSRQGWGGQLYLLREKLIWALYFDRSERCRDIMGALTIYCMSDHE